MSGRIRLSFLTFILLCCSVKVSASNEVVIAVGFTKPPYVIREDNSGFELELIQAIFSQLNSGVKFIYVPFAHSPNMLKVSEVDAVLTLNANIVDKSLLSDPYIVYQNVAISLKNKAIDLNSISDLQTYSIVAFQNARKILGASYARAANASPDYSEISDQVRQPMLLAKERCDVLIMDVNIFDHLIKNKPDFTQQDFDIHFIFPKMHYRVAFKDNNMLQQFNQQLAIYKQSQAYQVLLNKYQFRQ